MVCEFLSGDYGQDSHCPQIILHMHANFVAPCVKKWSYQNGMTPFDTFNPAKAHVSSTSSLIVASNEFLQAVYGMTSGEVLEEEKFAIIFQAGDCNRFPLPNAKDVHDDNLIWLLRQAPRTIPKLRVENDMSAYCFFLC